MDYLIYTCWFSLIDYRISERRHELIADMLSLNTRKESTTKGFIVVIFLSLIRRVRLLNRMRETDLLKKYTIEKLLLELENGKK